MIQKYRVLYSYDKGIKQICGLELSNDGDFVLYTDYIKELQMFEKAIEAQQRRCDALKEMIMENETASHKIFECILKEEPYKDDMYIHLPYCNTDNRNIPGTPGVTCNCLPKTRATIAALTAENMKQLKALNGIKSILSLGWTIREREAFSITQDALNEDKNKTFY